MASTRKTLQTIQIAPKSGKVSRNENDDDLIKLHKANIGTISKTSELKQPTQAVLSEFKENSGTNFNPKTKVSQNNRVNKKLNLVDDNSSLKTATTANLSQCDKSVERRASLSDHNNSLDDISWMTASDPPEEYWKELAEQRRIALEEALQENEELYEAVDSLNEIISSQKNELVSQAAEICKLRELYSEVERMSSILEELTGDQNDCENQQ